MSFLRLPAELRNRIYELCVVSPGEISAEAAIVERNGHETQRYGLVNRRLLVPPPITQACTQTRTEALPIFYGQNNFVAYIDEIELWTGFVPLRSAKNIPYIKKNAVRGIQRQSDGPLLGPMRRIRLHEVSRWLKAIGKDSAKLILKFIIKMPLAGCAGFPRQVATTRDMLRLLGLQKRGIRARKCQFQAGVQIAGRKWNRSHSWMSYPNPYRRSEVRYQQVKLGLGKR